MKKSFKKAGAAVLSMSMLLSMGAVTLPVYADNTIGDSTTKGYYAPAQVEITIANAANSNATGVTSNQDDATHHYEYLKDVENATVNLYRVATLTGSGWKWDSAIEIGGVMNNNPDVVSDFETLLEKTEVDGVEVSTTSAVELQSLASKLERIITTLNAATPNTVRSLATATVTKDGDSYTTAVLPIDDDLFGGETQNVNGYYLITADTNVAGTVMQPVLVHLKNGKIEGKAYVMKLSLKGTNIDIDKSIEKVETRVDVDDEVKTTDTKADGDRTLTDSGDVATTKNTAVVSRDDVVTYTIKTGVPKYDPKLVESSILTYSITDTPEDGINVIGYEDNGTYMTPRSSTAPTSNSKIKVYYSEDDKLVLTGNKHVDGTDADTNADVDILLNEHADYDIAQIIAPQDASTVTSGANGAGFVVNITGAQLRGKKEQTTNGNTTYVANSQSAMYDSANDISNTMEGGYIFVVFEADMTEELDSQYRTTDGTAEALATTVDDLTYEDITTAAATYVENGTKDRQAIAAGAAAFDTQFGDNAADELTKIKAIIQLRVDLAEDASRADIYNSDPDNVANFGLGTDEPWHAATDDELKAYAIAAFNAHNTAIAARNTALAGSKSDDAAANGTKNTAELKYGNKYATGQGEVTMDDTTKVYTTNLDLKKVVIDNNIKEVTDEDDLTKPIYWKSGIAADAENYHDSTKDGSTTTDKEEAEKDGGRIIYQDGTTATNWTSNIDAARKGETFVYLKDGFTERAADSEYTLNPNGTTTYDQLRKDGYSDKVRVTNGSYAQFTTNGTADTLPVMIAAPADWYGENVEYADFMAAVEAGQVDFTNVTVLESEAIKIVNAPLYVTDKEHPDTATSYDRADADTDGGDPYTITKGGYPTQIKALAEQDTDGNWVYIDAYAGSDYKNDGTGTYKELDTGVAGAGTPFYRTTDVNRALKDAEGNPYYYSAAGRIAPSDYTDAYVESGKYVDYTNTSLPANATIGTEVLSGTTDYTTADESKALRDGGEPVQATDAKGNPLYEKKTNLYDDDTQHTPVQGAVFELREVHSAGTKYTGSADAAATGDDLEHSRGYAVTNKDGKLVMLTPEMNGNAIKYYDSEAEAKAALTNLDTKESNAGEITNGDKVYYEAVTVGTETKYVVYQATNNNAWTGLGAGTYELEELFAPTGYKKWGSVATFTITSDTKEDDHYGNFSGTSESDVFVGANGTKASADNVATFTLADTAITINGHTYSTATVLQNEILNEYNDALPATGGMGTILFTAGGIAVILMAGALFVVYMKKRNTEEEE